MLIKKKNVLLISGSIRIDASSKIILTFVKSHMSAYNVITYDEIDIIPHFNPDIDKDQLPSVVHRLYSCINAADGVIICSPEYVFSLPAVLKNMIEWTVSTTLFSNKPVATIIAAASGEKALESVKLIMRTIEARLPDESTLLIQGIRGKINQDGEIGDKETKRDLLKIIRSLINCMEDPDGKPTKYTEL